MSRTLPRVFDSTPPPDADLTVLHSLPHPACLHDGGYDVVAANEAFRKLFPGTGPGANLMTAILLEPMARYRLGDWEAEAQVMVSAFRAAAPELNPARVEEIVNLARRSPDWDRLWDSQVPPIDPRERTVLMNDPVTRKERRMSVQTCDFQSPRRPWWLLTVVPMD